MFSNPFPEAFGLDIGDLSIKFVQLYNSSLRHRSATFDYRVARSIRLPHGLILDGELQQPEKIRHYIEHLLTGVKRKQKPVRSPWIVASLPETRSFIKLIELPKPENEIIEDDIKESLKKHVPFDLDDKKDPYYLDWQIIPMEKQEKDTTSILVGTVPKKTADSYTYLFESLGLGVIALEIEALSIARAMVTAKKKYVGEARAILDIGAARSSLIIFDNDTIQFSTSLSYSGEKVTAELEDKLNIDYDKAEKIKINRGLKYSKENDVKKAWEVMSKTTDNLVQEIEKAIKFYYSHFKNTNKINHITMCGSGSAMKNLPDVLSHKLNIESKPGRVWKNLSSKKGKLPNRDESLGFATAIGLALRAADNPFIKKDII
ncbi:MAG: hypothetical protein GF349_05040 [Candidatus Magasanikbacteria bacterium]|nr:hypothetical protein [Candidatus Magasanikbacteria bacterium]